MHKFIYVFMFIFICVNGYIYLCILYIFQLYNKVAEWLTDLGKFQQTYRIMFFIILWIEQIFVSLVW